MRLVLTNTLLFVLCLPFSGYAQSTAGTPNPALSPINIDVVHEGDTKITGTSPLAKLALRLKGAC